jgi:HD-like signal output (HDOD) protein
MKTGSEAAKQGELGKLDPILDGAIVELMAKDDLRIPPYPAVAMQIQELIARGDYGIDELGRLAESDQVIAAHTIRVANSAVYSRGSTVTSVKQAVQRVGAADLARIALASRVGALATSNGALAPLRRRCWLDGLASAFLCQALAPGRKLSADVAFAAGLLHDFGHVVAVTCLERIAAEGKGTARPEDEWSAIADRYHVELGMVIAARWKLPTVLADVLAMHHLDTSAGAADPALLDLVAAVDEITALLARHAHVGLEELRDLTLLQGGEMERVLRAIHQLGPFVASFESAEHTAAPSGPLLIANPPPPPLPPGAPSLPVLLAFGGKTHRYKLVGLGPKELWATGADDVPTHVLMEMMVNGDKPVEGFAVVRRSWQLQGERRLLVQPWALSGPAGTTWRALAGKPA